MAAKKPKQQPAKKSVAPAKPLPPHTSHKIKDGKCSKCARQGSDLAPPCPGYPTAAEYLKPKEKHRAKSKA